jgi:serine/threonine protein kinase, bacterial
MSTSTAHNLVGHLLMEKYLVIEHREVGGFSQTYLAVDTESPSSACYLLKIMDAELNPGMDFHSLHQFFAAEAQALGRLGGVAPIGLATQPVPKLISYCRDRSQVYLLQEFIEGERLDLWMDNMERPRFKAVIQLFAEVLLILYQIHKQGIIHCDIKPSNLIRRDQDHKLFLIDFGACCFCHTEPIACNYNPDFALGTPGYMPEEQAHGRPQFNSDLYALGMMMIQMITGVAPQNLEHHPMTRELNWHHYLRKPIANSQLIPILDRMVRINADNRYQTVHAVMTDLQHLLPKNTTARAPIFRVKLPRQQPSILPSPDPQTAPTLRKETRHPVSNLAATSALRLSVS